MIDRTTYMGALQSAPQLRERLLDLGTTRLGRKQQLAGLFEARGSRLYAQLPSLRSGNSSRTLSGTSHPSLFAFSTSLLRTRLKSLNAFSLRAVVIGNLFRCSIQRRNSMSARPVFCTRRNTIIVSSM